VKEKVALVSVVMSGGRSARKVSGGVMSASAWMVQV
jgi:hypothetical protein